MDRFCDLRDRHIVFRLLSESLDLAHVCIAQLIGNCLACVSGRFSTPFRGRFEGVFGGVRSRYQRLKSGLFAGILTCGRNASYGKYGFARGEDARFGALGALEDRRHEGSGSGSVGEEAL